MHCRQDAHRPPWMLRALTMRHARSHHVTLSYSCIYCVSGIPATHFCQTPHTRQHPGRHQVPVTCPAHAAPVASFQSQTATSQPASPPFSPHTQACRRSPPLPTFPRLPSGLTLSRPGPAQPPTVPREPTCASPATSSTPRCPTAPWRAARCAAPTATESWTGWQRREQVRPQHRVGRAA